jgi:predicted ATPase/class 3 adenylate cyclase
MAALTSVDMVQLPEGVVTFLFTDVEGSTRLWEEAPASMMDALRMHDDVIDRAAAFHHGVSVKPRGEGDSRFVVFPDPVTAVAAVAEVQLALAAVDWPTPRPVKVRAALHTGTAELELGDYYGSAVNRAARLRSIAHGGQTVLSGSTFELVHDDLPDGVTLVDKGLHQLKDLTRPEHVFQVEIAGLEGSFPPLMSLDAIPNNLPEQSTDLIGREDELELVTRELDRTRLLTIMAPGGTGKTRLAIQAAADSAGKFPDGVFFIALADISSSVAIVQAVAESIGVSLSSDEDTETQLLDYLATRRALLVFDNFEHVSDGATIVSKILSAAPQVSVIATSRSKLNLTGESVIPLKGLGTAWEAPEQALHVSGVQLFLSAARRARPGFELQSEDLDPLARILTLTSGMPLAILLAAAWANMLSVSEIASEIEKSLDFLQAETGDVPDRHRSIRAVFEYSWQLLSTDERRVFTALSVFRGGFTRQAAEAVTGASLRDLAALIDKSLVTPNPDTGRFAVHELLRQYAQAELEGDPDHSTEVTDAHALYFAELVSEAFGRMPDDQKSMLSRIEKDLENVRRAWRHSLTRNDGVNVRRMVGGIWFLHEARGWYPAGDDLLAEAVGLRVQSDDASVAAAGAMAVSLKATFDAVLRREPEAAADAALEAVEMLRGGNDPEALFFSLVGRLACLLYFRRFGEVIAAYDEMSSLVRSTESEWPVGRKWEACWKNMRAFVALRSGDLGEATRLLEESKDVLEPMNECMFMTWNLGHRARVALAEGRVPEAIDLFRRSADRARQIGFDRGLQLSLADLGDAALAAGDHSAAEAALLESLEAAERTRMVPEMLGTVVKVARVFTATGKTTAAVALLATVLADPSSSRQIFSETTPVSAMATAELEKLQHELDPGEYHEALDLGRSRSFGVTVKELIDSRV